MDMKLPPADKQVGNFLLVRAENAESYWQPIPANGHVAIHVAPHLVEMDKPIAVGTQTVGKGCYVREHAHDNNEEVLYFVRGRGKVVINGEQTFELAPGTTLFLGKGTRHTFINESDEEELHFVWIMNPGGLEVFFKQIGRLRTHGEPTPEPFARPENIAEIEANTVFAKLSGAEQ
ncbi:cupin domain-containing protein [Trinickia mobilis]|uniref:cupin domain-containing protein n=1 Tax=Trinickia mobilis TaxID=2816356 RepID=UPI001F5CF0F9|nr:cupin domain-containing protein [Trinickia mobilis]